MHLGEKVQAMVWGDKLCPCRSGKMSHWESDARGIPLCRVCEDCREEKLSHYRKDVLTNPNYEAIEPIEPEPFTECSGDGDDSVGCD